MSLIKIHDYAGNGYAETRFVDPAKVRAMDLTVLPHNAATKFFLDGDTGNTGSGLARLNIVCEVGCSKYEQTIVYRTAAEAEAVRDQILAAQAAS